MDTARRDAVEKAVRTYSGLLYRTSLMYLRNADSAQDAVQDTFVRLLEKAPVFEDENHEKAWLLRVNINICKDMLRYGKHHGEADIDSFAEVCADPDDRGVLEAVAALPVKYREMITLYYLHGYSTAEIALILGISKAATEKRLQRGRDLLKLEIITEEASEQ